MHDRTNIRAEYFPFPIVSDSLKAMTTAEFAALGSDDMVFLREITGAELALFIPQAALAEDDAVFSMLVAADGSPVLVTDNQEGIDDWLDDRDVVVVRRH